MVLPSPKSPNYRPNMANFDTSTGFPAQTTPETKLLILGSMPGVASLKANNYYAHPRNAFWPIMAKLYGINIDCNIENRIESLNHQGVGLWDVVKQCARAGSLDSNIDQQSVIPNDFSALSRHLPLLNTIAFNGKTAAALFTKHLIKSKGVNVDKYKLVTLPSSSPANASLSINDKYLLWQEILASG